MDGYLLIDKPKNWTSFDVVNKLRFMAADALHIPVKQMKVGHAGTLDPNANGLLIILFGGYTKRQAEFMKLDKTYSATVRLGATSDTDDADGRITTRKVLIKPKLADIKLVLNKQTGQIEQLPPQYSAIKQSGKKAYESARQGQPIELKPRPVTVRSITQVSYNWPYLKFVTHVSSGTYIRSMARDVGELLGTGAYLDELRRESIGQYSIKDAIKLGQLEPSNLKNHLKQT